jgi:hypothetical protein
VSARSESQRTARLPLFKKDSNRPHANREAAQDYSPRRKPWVKRGYDESPNGAKDWFSRTHVDVREPPISSVILCAPVVKALDFPERQNS